MSLGHIYERSINHFLQPIRPLLDDPSVSEILINGADLIFFERAGRISRSEVTFESEESLMAACRNIAEYVDRPIGNGAHSMDGRLPDGSRIHIIVPPSSRGGIHVSIRKFQKSKFDLEQLVAFKSISPMGAEFLKLCVLIHRNMVVAGGTGSGKTSLLNAMSTCISERERIIVIEDSSELQLFQPHTVYLEAQPDRGDGHGEVSIRELFVDSLRMRPDRIVIGEVRRGEALDLVQSMISGHSGALATVHASSALDALIRLETLCLMAGLELPVLIARRQVASAIQVIVRITRMDDGSRKIIGINEVLGQKDDEYIINELFAFRSEGRDEDGMIMGELQPTGVKPTFSAMPYTMGFQDEVVLTKDLFQKPEDW